MSQKPLHRKGEASIEKRTTSVDLTCEINVGAQFNHSLHLVDRTWLCESAMEV